MFKVNWQHLDPTSFQRFCNALLWLEIGDEFLGFEAPGKDGGIDGRFDGTYQQKKGPWRFQYKFHTTSRRSAVASIKSELKTELTKLKDEKRFVVLTNVSFLPAERKEVEQIAKDYFSENNFKNKVFTLWDGAVLSRLFLKHPLLKLWMEEGQGTASLTTYKVKFEKQLLASPVAINTLSNYFVARETSLEQLQKFLKDANKHRAIIKGEAGIGKTRLAVEFFKKIFSPRSKWTCLCLNSFSFDFDKLRFVLGNGKNYLLLVDDAQNFSQQQLSDLYRLGGENNGGITKVIFTTRSLSSYDAFRLINSFEKEGTVNILLDKLSKEDTKKVFEAHLSNSYLSQFVDQLVLISRGRPVLIVGILHAAEKKENIAKIKSEGGFAGYVLEYFDDFLNQVVLKAGISHLVGKQILALICLLEPLVYTAPQTLKSIAKSEEVSEEVIDFFFKQLRELNFSSGNYQQAIKPDYYSDVFLKSFISQAWLEKKLSQYPDFKANILTNLASLDEVERDDMPAAKTNLLDTYLGRYVEEMGEATSSESFKERLRVMYSITFQKPQLAQRSVQQFFSAVHNHEHSFYKDNIKGRQPEMLQHDGTFSLVKGILNELLYRSEFFNFVFDAVLKLYRFTGDKSMEKFFSYQHPVYLYQSSIQIQKLFVKRVAEPLPQSETEQILFLIECLQNLLELSFTSSKWGVLNEDTIQITKHYLPAVPIVEKHRLEILAVLKDYFRHYTNDTLRLASLKVILDVPREIARNRRDSNSYKSDKEVAFILQFL